MIQFSFNRFRKLARWSLTNDKRYFVKAFLQVTVTLLFIFLFFTIFTHTKGMRAGNYGPCAYVVGAMILITMVTGPAYMFYSMEGKHAQQTLMMLPASNFEKYLMRYSTWILLLPIYVVAFFTADLLQYVIHSVLGHNDATFVTSVIVKLHNEVSMTVVAVSNSVVLKDVFVFLLWCHSMYALGCTFFRSRKFNWVLTTIAIVILVSTDAWLYDENYSSSIVANVICLCLTVLNFWLSYRLFCRTQVIGKYVNLLK